MPGNLFRALAHMWSAEEKRVFFLEIEITCGWECRREERGRLGEGGETGGGRRGLGGRPGPGSTFLLRVARLSLLSLNGDDNQ